MLPVAKMRILIFHGYPLRGTGSNVYNAELAQALVRAGHDVDLVCQEKDARQLEWVDAIGSWDNTGALNVEPLGRERPKGHGSCTVHLPPIADRLPVYVADRYEHFSARTFDQFDDAELDFYIARNVMAVRAVVERSRPDCALANHMVMGPYILAEALGGEIAFATKIHGSAMEYIVRPHPRFLPFAREGVEASRSVLVGSRHIAERTWDTLRITGLEQRIFLGPPGVDTNAFRPRKPGVGRAGLAELGERVLALPRLGYGPAQAAASAGLYERVRMAAHSGTSDHGEIAADIAALRSDYDNDGIDMTAGDQLRELSKTDDSPLALFVGKLIVSKGVDLALAAWPLVLERLPDARLVITGFGAYREGLELMLSALSDGDLTTVRWLADGGRVLEGGELSSLKLVTAFLDSLDELDDEGAGRNAYIEAARGMRERVTFVGRFDHDLLVDLIPAADCQLVPSTFPEAFGMVAAEAAACGVPPISAEHSGLAEVTTLLQQNLSGASASLLSFRVTSTAVEQLAARVIALLGLSPTQRQELQARLVQTAQEHFSWDGVARGVLDAALGRSERLRRP